MKSVNHEQLKQHIKRAYEKKIPLFVWGSMGIGKSDTVKNVTENMDLKFVDVRISQLEPSDLRGLPSIANGVTRWLPPSWLPTDRSSKGILFFDELNLAPPSIQAAAYQLILDRKIGEYCLPDGWMIISAGNRIEDKANVFEMPKPLSNRFTHIELGVPTVEAWTDWALKNGVDNRVVSFLNFKPSRLYGFDSKIKEQAFPTPRSFYFCSKLIEDIDDYDELNRYISSAVGEGTAVEMCAFLKLQRKIDIVEILKNPKSVKEIKEIDMKYSLLSVASEHFRKNKKTEMLDKMLKITEYLEAEFSALLLRFLRQVDADFFKKNVVNCSGFKHLKENYIHLLV